MSPNSSTPPPLPRRAYPPPLPTAPIEHLAQTTRSAALLSLVGTLIFTGGLAFGISAGEPPLDLIIFAACVVIVSWMGLIGIIRRKKNLAWGAYVTFSILLIGIPIGTLIGIYGIIFLNRLFRDLK